MATETVQIFYVSISHILENKHHISGHLCLPHTQQIFFIANLCMIYGRSTFPLRLPEKLLLHTSSMKHSVGAMHNFFVTSNVVK